jgi:hypothetical protein
MKTIRSGKRFSLSGLLLFTLLGSSVAASGCAYGGMAAMPDGTVLVARNGLLGSLRKIYACKVNGSTMSCVEVANSP